VLSIALEIRKPNPPPPATAKIKNTANCITAIHSSSSPAIPAGRWRCLCFVHADSIRDVFGSTPKFYIILRNIHNPADRFRIDRPAKGTDKKIFGENSLHYFAKEPSSPRRYDSIDPSVIRQA
jgi:hypothetical protein